MNVAEEATGPQGNSNFHHEKTRKEHARWQTNGTRSGAEEEHTGALSAAHLQQLQARGLTLETIHAAGLWSATTQPVVSALGFPATATGLVIPYHDPISHEVVLNRIRPDTPPIRKGKPAKYLTPHLGKNHLYFPPRAQDWIGEASRPIVLTEGEFKALLATQFGLPCIGLVGVYGFRGKTEDGETTGPIDDLDRVTWPDRLVTIIYDSDVQTNPDVKKARLALAQELYRRGARVVNAIDLPHGENGEKQGLDDFLHAHGREALHALERHTMPSIPLIKITTELSQMVDDTEAALMQLPGPILYQRARMICQIAPAGPSSRWLQRPPNTPIIIPTNVIGLREYGDKAAIWRREDKRAKGWVKVIPPAMLFETLAARPSWKFPVLEGIVSVPVLRPDGVIIQTPGYDRETGLYLDFNGVTFPPIPDAPTRDDARAALDILYEPFADFPLQSPCHTSAAVASTLTFVGRHAIRGNVPAFTVSAHTKGTGKGLLVNTCAMIGTGRTAPTWTQTLDEAEEAKRLLTLAMEGDACAHIDNVVHPLGNAPLASALTSATVKGRLLGRNASQEAPWTAILFASGNNMTFTSDMARRIVPIHLDAQCEHPELRSHFTHSLLLEWVQQQRPRLVTAALTTLKAFFCAGCPPQDIPEYGSFEAWSRLIRYALVWAGWHDPNDGRANIEAESDPSYEQLATLLTCWGGCYPDGKPRTLKVVMGDCEQRRGEANTVKPPNEWNDLWDALASYDSKYDGRKLDGRRIGNAMRTIEGRVLDGWRLVRDGTHNRAVQWKREQLK